MAGIQYLKLSKFISVEMSLPQKERIRAKDILKIVRDQSERLMEIGPAIPDFLKVEYQDKFKDNECAVPEVANGIHKININRRVVSSPIVEKQEIKIEVR